MKYIKLFPLIILATIALSSCDKVDHSFQGDPFVAFSLEEARVFKNASGIKIPVMVTDDRTEEVTVTFELKPRKTIEGADIVEGVDFVLENESTTLTFAPGEGIKYITVKPINDYTFTGDKIIDVVLVSNSKNYSMGVPGPDGKMKECMLVIRESNCPFNPEEWQGKVKGWEEATTGGWWTDADSPSKWEFVEESAENVFVFKVSGFFYAQCISTSWAWYAQGEVEFLPVEVTIDLSNPAKPKYSLKPDMAFIDGEGWGGFIKEVNSAPLTIDICGRYLEIPYTLTGTSWVHDYLFTIKYQF